jgi:hypothetical protein
MGRIIENYVVVAVVVVLIEMQPHVACHQNNVGEDLVSHLHCLLLLLLSLLMMMKMMKAINPLH